MRIYHVDGRQDRQAPVSDLSLPEKVNVMYDKGCTEELLTRGRLNQEKDPRNPLTRELASLKIERVSVTTGYKRALYKRKYRKKIADHMGITISLFERIDWEGHARTMDAAGGPALRIIVWGQHPTCSHLRIIGQ